MFLVTHGLLVAWSFPPPELHFRAGVEECCLRWEIRLRFLYTPKNRRLSSEAVGLALVGSPRCSGRFRPFLTCKTIGF